MITGRRNKFSSGVVVVRGFGPEWRYLLLRVFRNWDFPKGRVEDGELPLEAARREVEEETGLAALDFRWGEAYRETAPYSGGKIARYYIAASADGEVWLPINPELGRPEHHEFRWCGIDTARKLVPERIVPILEWAHSTVVEYRS
jgi:8-oxo-dGTP pyrophosphatase MutT (NUDIX family)